MSESISSTETFPRKPTVYERDGQWYATLGGNKGVLIKDKTLAKTAFVAMEGKKRYRSHSRSSMISKHFADIAQATDCHLAMTYALGAPSSEAVSISKKYNERELQRQGAEVSDTIIGARASIDRVLETGEPAVVIFRQGPTMGGRFPAFPGGGHSFIVLGKDDGGRYVSFEKTNPGLRAQFKLTNLTRILLGWQMFVAMPLGTWTVSPFSTVQEIVDRYRVRKQAGDT